MSTDDYEFPFDFWAQLAAEDPGSFEDARRLMIESFIDAAPPERQQRLRGLQWQIDQVRARSQSPLGACVKISNMMWDKVMGPDGLVDCLEELGSGETAGRPAPRTGTIIPLRPRN